MPPKEPSAIKNAWKGSESMLHNPPLIRHVLLSKHKSSAPDTENSTSWTDSIQKNDPNITTDCSCHNIPMFWIKPLNWRLFRNVIFFQYGESNLSNSQTTGVERPEKVSELVWERDQRGQGDLWWSSSGEFPLQVTTSVSLIFPPLTTLWWT